MGGADFTGVTAKLRRGDEHFCALRREVLSWVEGKPYTYFFTQPDGDDPKSKRRLIHLRYKRHPPVERWSLILGDLLNCYRSALDHSIYSLAIMCTGQDPPPSERSAQFPICDSPGGWPAWTTQRRISDLTPRIRAVVQDHQPYIREISGLISPLRALRELHDRDKHRVLHLAVLLPERFAVTVQSGPPLMGVAPIPGPVKPEAPILEAYFTEAPKAQGVQVNISVTLGIGVENPQAPGMYYRLMSVAGGIRRNVRTVIGDLERVAR